jgi:hypothetical protein
MHMMFNSIPPVLTHIKAERFRALGVGSHKRSPQLPDVPTTTEAAVPAYEAITWFGMLAPAKTPKAILAHIQDAIAKVIKTPELRAQLESQGAEPGSGRAAEFGELIHREYPAQCESCEDVRRKDRLNVQESSVPTGLYRQTGRPMHDARIPGRDRFSQSRVADRAPLYRRCTRSASCVLRGERLL